MRSERCPALPGRNAANRTSSNSGSNIAQDNPAAADRVLDEIDAKCHLLAEHPRLGPARPDIRPDLRYFPVGSYLILYREIPGGVEIVRVVHGVRDLQDLFDT